MVQQTKRFGLSPQRFQTQKDIQFVSVTQNVTEIDSNHGPRL